MGKLAVILCEIDPSDGSLKNKYYYANSQILAQDAVDPNERYFYLHDRLGSVRQVVDCNAVTVATYTYNPYGEDFTSECDEDIYNPFKYTGQWYDAEIAQYYLRARQYDPQLMRFTGRDPVRGKQYEPLTLHRYLYCLNDPVDRTDPSGEISAASLVSGVVTGYSLYGHGVSLAAYAVDSGDDRFWTLSEATFDFMFFGAAAACINPFGPLTNILAYAFESVAEDVMGSVTGLNKAQALAIDVVAYVLYYKWMQYKEDDLGVTSNDIDDFKDWVWN